MYVEWQGFTEGSWTREVNVRDFIQKNYHPYEGNAEFLTVATPRTKQLWQKVLELMNLEREKGVLDVDTKLPTSITAHDAGYIDRELEQIVGLQTDKPLKRAIMPYGGIPKQKRLLLSIVKPIMTACLMLIPVRCEKQGNRGSLQGCPMPMDADALLVITVG